MVAPFIALAVGAVAYLYTRRLQMQEILTHKHLVRTHTHREDGSMLRHGSPDNYERTDKAMTNTAQPHKYLYTREAPSYLNQTRFSSEFVTADDSVQGIGGWY